VPVALLVVRAWQRRWVADDGMILMRAVDNLLAGNGPVLNAGERVEVSTSVLWYYLVALADLLTPTGPEWASVVLGIAAMAGGLVLGAWGMDRALRAGGVPAGLRLPLGAAIVAPIAAVWDFTTAGMEMGLVGLWLGGGMLALARLAEDGTATGETGVPQRARAPLWPFAVLGLGPLVRPDLGLMAVVLLAAAALIAHRAGRMPWARAVGTAVAMPVVYQVFRMGYYGVVVPHPAVAKSAAAAHWDLGATYLADLLGTYWLWVPLLLAAAALGLWWRAASPGRTLALVLAAPAAAGLLHGLYVVRVGGDFMHGRLLLPALLALALPVAAVPARRATLVLGAGVGLWALACLLLLRPFELWHPDGFIANERAYYVEGAGHPNPVTMEDYAEHPWIDRPSRAGELAAGGGAEIRVRGLAAAPRPDARRRNVIAVAALGIPSRAAGLDVHVVDTLGLADPIAARTERVKDRPGHGKLLPDAWVFGRFGADVSTLPEDGPSPEEVLAARAALDCPAVAELLDAVEGPLTLERFVRNVVRAPRLTALDIPRDPFEAARCPQG
jgi:arabinofuranosyltransferase